MRKKTNFLKVLKLFNQKKGFKTSVRKAILKAFKEEGNPINPKNYLAIAFLSYVLTRVYLRFYKWFTENIFFRKGVIKFMLYSLDVFIPFESKKVYEEIKSELIKISENL